MCARRSSRERERPDGVPELQLATLVPAPPAGDEWVHEIKYDGYRVVAVVQGGDVRMYTRNFLDWTPSFAPLAEALARLPARHAILDGEACTLLPDGRTVFGGGDDGGGGGEPVYMAFDLIALDGEDVAALPLVERKAKLAPLVAALHPRVRYSEHVADGAALLAGACARGLEGIVSKRRDQPYRGGRGMAWQKSKCTARQELVIGGYTEPTGARSGFGAILVGHFEGEALRYAGKVGTGFGQAALDELHALMVARAQDACPFTPAPPRAKTGARVHWIRPELVAEIAFMEWTPDGALRHPSFQGLRRDKPAREVRREVARLETRQR